MKQRGLEWVVRERVRMFLWGLRGPGLMSTAPALWPQPHCARAPPQGGSEAWPPASRGRRGASRPRPEETVIRGCQPPLREGSCETKGLYVSSPCSTGTSFGHELRMKPPLLSECGGAGIGELDSKPGLTAVGRLTFLEPLFCTQLWARCWKCKRKQGPSLMELTLRPSGSCMGVTHVRMDGGFCRVSEEGGPGLPGLRS